MLQSKITLSTLNSGGSVFGALYQSFSLAMPQTRTSYFACSKGGAAGSSDTSGLPARPVVVGTVIHALRSAWILEGAAESTRLAGRFQQVEGEDSRAGKSHFRLLIFIQTLRDNLPGAWSLVPSQLLFGHFQTPGEIADRILSGG